MHSSLATIGIPMIVPWIFLFLFPAHRLPIVPFLESLYERRSKGAYGGITISMPPRAWPKLRAQSAQGKKNGRKVEDHKMLMSARFACDWCLQE